MPGRRRRPWPGPPPAWERSHEARQPRPPALPQRAAAEPAVRAGGGGGGSAHRPPRFRRARAPARTHHRPSRRGDAAGGGGGAAPLRAGVPARGRAGAQGAGAVAGGEGPGGPARLLVDEPVRAPRREDPGRSAAGLHHAQGDSRRGRPRRAGRRALARSGLAVRAHARGGRRLRRRLPAQRGRRGRVPLHHALPAAPRARGGGRACRRHRRPVGGGLAAFAPRGLDGGCPARGARAGGPAVRRRWRDRLRVPLLVVVALDVGVYLAYTMPRSLKERRAAARVSVLRGELERDRRVTAALRDRAETMKTNRTDADRFYARLGPKATLSQVRAEITAIARELGLKVGGLSYSPEGVKGGEGVAQLLMRMNVSGTYRELVAFLDRLERSSYFVTVDQIQIGKRVTGEGALDIALSAFYRMPGEGGAEERP